MAKISWCFLFSNNLVYLGEITDINPMCCSCSWNGSFSHPLIWFQKRSQFNWNRLVFPAKGSHAPCLAGLLLCWTTVRTRVKWSPALLGGAGSPGQQTAGGRGLAAPLWAVHLRNFPVEMPLCAQGPNTKQGKGMGRELHRGRRPDCLKSLS